MSAIYYIYLYLKRFFFSFKKYTFRMLTQLNSTIWLSAIKSEIQNSSWKKYGEVLNCKL